MTRSTLHDGQSGPPTSQSTHSYWHKDPSVVLLRHRTTESLPPTADVIIVGTGITGTFAARELVGQRSVLMLEAREACWGATGRNGGHCQPMVYASKPSVARFELETYEFLKDFVDINEISCDWHTVGGVHGIFGEESLSLVEKIIERLRCDHPDLAKKAILVKDEESRKALRMPQASGAVYQPAAAKLWPYKLVAWVLESLLRECSTDRFNLQTNTPVEHLQHSDNQWIVHTSRGQVAAKDVLLASNGYTSHLLPKMTGIITPVRGQIVGLTPPSDHLPLEHSHVWTHGIEDDYLIQRDDDKLLILGGERFAEPGGLEGVWNDDEVSIATGEKLRRQLSSSMKLRNSDKAEEEELSAAYEWSGIMGFAKDKMPWVGTVPVAYGGVKNTDNGECHLWISAGYSGHGMPVAARCGVAVARMMTGNEVGFDMPQEYMATEERVERMERVSGVMLRETMVDELRAVLADLEGGDQGMT